VYQSAPLTMSWCVNCHRNPAPHLRPLSAITAMGFTPQVPQRELGPQLVQKYHVRSLTNCTTCHR
jgi:mono/diheme cytochrome c family protein